MVDKDCPNLSVALIGIGTIMRVFKGEIIYADL